MTSIRHHRNPIRQSAARSLVIATLALGSLAASGALAGDSFTVPSHVIASGGVSHAANACFSLAGTAGQPLAGRATGGPFTVNSGFWALPTPHESIFKGAFEECQP